MRRSSTELRRKIKIFITLVAKNNASLSLSVRIVTGAWINTRLYHWQKSQNVTLGLPSLRFTLIPLKFMFMFDYRAFWRDLSVVLFLLFFILFEEKKEQTFNMDSTQTYWERELSRKIKIFITLTAKLITSFSLTKDHFRFMLFALRRQMSLVSRETCTISSSHLELD